MGLGRLFNRDLQYVATDTNTGLSDTFTVVTDGSPGMFADWDNGEYRGGMSIPGAWRASLLLSDLIGSLPWHAYRERAGLPVEKLDPTPPLLDQPFPDEPRMSTFSSWALDLIWCGNAVGIIADRNREGWPTAVIPVQVDNVQVKRVQEWDPYPLPVGEIVYLVGNKAYPAGDVLHVKGPCKPGQLRGMGVLEAHLNGALRLAMDLDASAGSISGAGIPTGLLKSTDPDLDSDTAADLKTAWMTAQARRTIAVLNETTDFQPLAWNPTEMQLIEARTFSLQQLALIFGVPMSFLGVEQGSRTYTNVEMEGLNLLRYSLSGHLVRFEQTLSRHLPRGTWAKANVDSLLRADTLSRYQAHEIALRAGFLTPDEVRELEDRPPFTPVQRVQLAQVEAPTEAPNNPSLEEA